MNSTSTAQAMATISPATSPADTRSHALRRVAGSPWSCAPRIPANPTGGPGSVPQAETCSHFTVYDDYMDVAVRELKAKLSAYLQQAAAGEVITVTDRGRPVAVLGPIPGRIDLAAAV